MKPGDDLLDLVERRRQAARDLPGWRSGPERLLTLLQHATRLRAMEFAQGLKSDLPWESVLAQIIRWHHEIPLGDGPCGDEEALTICKAALAADRLDNLHDTIRAGGYEVRRQGDAFRVQHRWNPAIEAADALLEYAAIPAIRPEVTSVEKRWIKMRWEDSRELPPAEVLLAATERARMTIDAYRRALPEGNLPDSFELDGRLTVGHAAAVLSVVMGLASLCESATHMRKRTETTLVRIRRARLQQMIAELLPTMPLEHIDATVGRLIYAADRSCRTSPLSEFQETIIVCPPLITSRAIDAIILRSSAYDPSRYGAIGERQGRRAAKWKDWLGQIPGVLVADRLKARRKDRRAAGDLDVVAVDTQRRRGVCFEVKWPIDAISLHEVMKTEGLMTETAGQVDRLRAEIISGAAAVQMPKGWPDFSEITWTWAVATPQQLCLRPLPFDDIHATSFRYMACHGAPRSLDDVIDALTSPDLPVAGVHFQIEAVDFMLGRQKVILDGIGLAPSGWKPRLWI